MFDGVGICSVFSYTRFQHKDIYKVRVSSAEYCCMRQAAVYLIAASSTEGSLDLHSERKDSLQVRSSQHPCTEFQREGLRFEGA